MNYLLFQQEYQSILLHHDKSTTNLFVMIQLIQTHYRPMFLILNMNVSFYKNFCVSALLLLNDFSPRFDYLKRHYGQLS